MQPRAGYATQAAGMSAVSLQVGRILVIGPRQTTRAPRAGTERPRPLDSPFDHPNRLLHVCEGVPVGFQAAFRLLHVSRAHSSSAGH